MKNKIQKLVLVGLTLPGLLGQIGCGSMYGGEYEECSPDHLELTSTTTHKEYNGKIMGDDYWSLGPSISSHFYSVDHRYNLVSIVKIDDNGAVTKIESGSLVIENIDTPNFIAVENFPLKVNQTKTIHIDTNLEALYYSIINVSNGKNVALPPMNWVHTYEGWTDDTSFQIHYQAEEKNYLFHFQVTDVANLDWVFTAEDTGLESGTNDAQNFINFSPLSDMKVELKTTSKKWTGSTVLKVLENLNRKYSLQETTEITDGENIFTETSTTHYEFKNRECHTHYQIN